MVSSASVICSYSSQEGSKLQSAYRSKNHINTLQYIMFSNSKLVLLSSLYLSAMSNTASTAYIQEIVQDFIVHNYIYYATLSVLVYDISDLLLLLPVTYF